MDDLQARLQHTLPDRYAVKQELGRGGMSVVYLAWDRKHECEVALKVLRPELSATLGADRFLDEIKTAARLTHPYILKLHDSGPAGDLLYYVMPYVEGESLRQRLVREGALPIPDALRIAREVAEALDYAHGKNVVHRDIKPENILIEGGHAVVSDFGIALAISEAHPRRTTSGLVVGTTEYMSPEQSEGKRDLDGRSDIYSLGVVLYEMLSGHRPRYDVDGTVQTLERLRPGLSDVVVDILKRSLATMREDRYATAAEMVDALSRAGGSRPFYDRRWVRVLAIPGVALLAVGTWLIVGAFAKPLDDKKVVVFPLAERGRSGIGDQVALMIGSALEHTEPLQWVDGWRLLGPADRENIGALSPKTAQRIARSRAARYFLQGSILENGDSASVILWLTDAKSGADVARVSAAGSTRVRSVPELGLEAVTELLPRLLPPGGRIDLTMLSGRRPAAVANWLQGEREYRGSKFGPALEYFRKAVEADSALAAAAVRGAQAASWENLNDEAVAFAALALRHVSALPSRQANFARGLAAYYDGQADSAVLWLSRALRESPDWTEAHMALGETYYHELPNVTGSLDSLAAVEFALAAADSGFAPPRFHLAEIAIRSHDLERAAGAVKDFERSAPGASEWQSQIELMLQCAAGSPGSVDWKGVVGNSPSRALIVAQALAVIAAFPDCAEEAYRAILGDSTITMNYRWGALVGLQSLLAAQNRLRELRSILDSSVSSGVEFANRFYLLDALAGLDVGDRAAALAVDYERGAPGRSISPSVLWLLGTWHAQSGATAKAESLRALLVREAERTGGRPAKRYAEALGARLALQRGDTGAIARLRAVFAVGSRDELSWGLGEPLAADRLLLSEFLLRHDRPEDALAVAGVFDHSSPTTFLAFLRASLNLRREAARALRRPALVRRFEERLSTLGRGERLARQRPTQRRIP